MFVLQIVIGLILLAAGGELVVRGAVAVARRLGVSELLIGLTLVGFGTSTPELITSLNAAFAGSPGIAVGNVVGSNIGNILLIFAIVTLVRPVAVDPAALRRDGVVMLAATLVLIAIALIFGALSRLTGFVLLAGLGLYLWFAWTQEREGGAVAERREAVAQTAVAVPPGPLAWSLVVAFAGMALLIFGADTLVKGAITLASLAGLSETVIGLTIVALGTSLPELVASLAAALKGRADVAFGNIIGSNIYNLLGILGVTALVHPIAIPPDMMLREWVALYGAALLFLFHAAFGAKVGRIEGAFLLAHYALYCWLLLDPNALSRAAPA